MRHAASSTSYWLARLVEVLMSVALLGMTVMVVLQVLFRYVLGAPLHYTEEVARYLMIWTVMLGASLAVRSGAHFTVRIVQDRLPAPAGRALSAVVQFAVAAFIVVFLFFSVELLETAGRQHSPAARIPLTLVYAAAPVGAALMLVFLVTQRISGTPMRTLPSEQIHEGER